MRKLILVLSFMILSGAMAFAQSGVIRELTGTVELKGSAASAAGSGATAWRWTL